MTSLVLGGIMAVAQAGLTGGFVQAESETKPLDLPGKVVFQTDREAREHHGIFLLKDGQMSRIVDGAFPKLTRDGRKLLYKGGGGHSVKVLDLVTLQTETLDWTEVYAPYDYDLSPDGKWLAFTSHHVHQSKRVEPQSNLMVARIDGSEVKQLTDAPVGIYGPRWSPDGTRVLFYSGLDPHSDSDRTPGGIYLADPRTESVWKLDLDDAMKAGGGSWLPDGHRIVFSGDGENSVDQIYLFSIESKQTTQLTKNAHADWRYMAVTPSPDGKQILFVSARKGDPAIGQALYVINIDGTDERQVTPTQGIKKYGRTRWSTDFNPDWAP